MLKPLVLMVILTLKVLARCLPVLNGDQQTVVCLLELRLWLQLTSSCNIFPLTDILCWQIIFNDKSLEAKTVQTPGTQTEVCCQANQHNTHGIVHIDSFGNERQYIHVAHKLWRKQIIRVVMKFWSMWLYCWGRWYLVSFWAVIRVVTQCLVARSIVWQLVP